MAPGENEFDTPGLQLNHPHIAGSRTTLGSKALSGIYLLSSQDREIFFVVWILYL